MNAACRRVPTHPDVVTGTESVFSVKVWEPWIRIVHWTMVGCVAVLSVTGFLICRPILFGGEGSNLMAWIRYAHLVFAWLLITVLIGRIVLAFTGNPWARWEQLVPVWAVRRQQVRHTLRYYLFLEAEPPEVVGHNPLAGLTYLTLYGVLLIDALTGIALEAESNRNGWQWALAGWLFRVLSAPDVRLIHHLIMWLVWMFVVFHSYAATMVDRVERGAEVSSMVGGWKLLPRARVEEELARDLALRHKRSAPPR